MAARSLRRADRLRARAARRGAAPHSPVGEADVRHVRRAARLLPQGRREGAFVSVALVGAGPGDPGLITVKGLELLRVCDVVVYDRLVAPELVDEAPGIRIERDRLK